MPDRERVIEGLKKAAEELARYAPMKVNGRCQMYFDGAIHLLKEQEPVKAIDCRTPYTSQLKDADKEAYSVGTGADTERHERKVMPDAAEG